MVIQHVAVEDKKKPVLKYVILKLSWFLEVQHNEKHLKKIYLRNMISNSSFGVFSLTD